MHVRGEHLRIVEPFLRDPIPRLARQDLGIDFLLPEHGQRLTLRVVLDAVHADQRVVTRMWRGNGLFDEVETLAYSDDLAGLRREADELRHLQEIERSRDIKQMP